MKATKSDIARMQRACLDASAMLGVIDNITSEICKHEMPTKGCKYCDLFVIADNICSKIAKLNNAVNDLEDE